MAFLVEDGTGVEGATSYLSVSAFRAMAADRGATVPVADAACETILVQAADYLELKRYAGDKFYEAQGLAFPRLAADGVTASPIPSPVVKAQYLLAIEAQNGSLTTAVRPSQYRKTKVDVLYVEYAKTDDLAEGLRFFAVDQLLDPYLGGSGGPFQVIRA